MASTMVTASTVSTALARNADRTRKTSVSDEEDVGQE
jgi:hypothetical protein